jgi:hypothetical protein
MHVNAPVLQSTVPTSQRFPVEHGPPAVHPSTHMPVALQLPPAHPVLAGWNTSSGHTVLTPSHASATSQSPAAIRHMVPAAAGPVGTQTGAAPVQSHCPCSQGFPVLHAAPMMQVGTQTPAPSHVPPGQAVPLGAKPSVGHSGVAPSHVSAMSQGPIGGRHTAPGSAGPMPRQVGAPPTHSVRPSSQVLVVQGSPGTHIVHPPTPSHASPAPQRVPAGRSVIPVHEPDPPPAQSSVPVVHGLPVVHEEPTMHSVHAPAALQVPIVPHGVPSGTTSDSTQKGAPPAPQLVSPLVHGLLVVHAAPSTQTSHMPAVLHARPSPQRVPGGRSAVGTQTLPPPEQSIVPLVQGSPVGHEEPSMHSLHSPPTRHAPVTPQGVPAGSSVVSKQYGLPVSHVISPDVHGLPVVQLEPGMQMSQLPASSHARPSAHVVPAGSTPLRMQIVAPLGSHWLIPVSHGLPVSHGASGTQGPQPSHAPASGIPGSRQKMLPPPPGGHSEVPQPASSPSTANETASGALRQVKATFK